jgi:hypothetical protein
MGQVWLFLSPFRRMKTDKKWWDKIDASLAPCKCVMSRVHCGGCRGGIAIAKKSSTVRFWFLKTAN